METLDEHPIQKSYSQSKHVKIIGRSLNSTHTLKPIECKIKPKIISTSKSRSRLMGKKTCSIDPSPIRSTSKKKKASELPSMTNLSSPIHIISSKDIKKRKTSKGPKVEKAQKRTKKQETSENQLKTEENTQEGRKSRTKLREIARRCSAEQIKPADSTKLKHINNINPKDHCPETNEKQRPGTTDLKKLKKLENNSKKSPSKKPGLLKLNSEQDIQIYIKEKKKKKNFEKTLKKFQDDQKEHERITGLISLEKQRKLSKTKRKNKGKGSKGKLIGLKSLRKKKNEEKSEYKNLTEDFRSAYKKENLHSNSSDESYLTSGLRTDRDDWINILDKKFTGSNSEFVEEFKAKMQKNTEKIKKIIEIHEQNYEKSEKSSSGYSDFAEVIVKPPSVLVGSLGSSIKPPIPPLSLSLLKNEEFYSDSSGEYNDYIVKKDESEEMNSNESSEEDYNDYIVKEDESEEMNSNESSEEDDYSKTKSENSTQWIIDVISCKSTNSDAKNKDEKVKKIVPAFKSLDLNKVKVEKSEESIDQGEDLNELVKLKSPRKHLIQGYKQAKEGFIEECFRDDLEGRGKEKVVLVNGRLEGNSGKNGYVGDKNAKDSGRVGIYSEKIEKLSGESEDGKKSGKDFKETEKIWKKWEKSEESGGSEEDSGDDEYDEQFEFEFRKKFKLEQNEKIGKTKKIEIPKKSQTVKKEKIQISPNDENKGVKKVDLLIKKNFDPPEKNEVENFSKNVQHGPSKSEFISDNKDLISSSNSKFSKKLPQIDQIEKNIGKSSSIKQPQRPTLMPSPKEQYKAGDSSEEKRLNQSKKDKFQENESKTDKIQEIDKNLKVFEDKEQSLKTQNSEKNNLLTQSTEKCPKLLKNPEKSPKLLIDPEKIPKLLKNPEKSPKLLKNPEKSPKLLIDPEKSPKLLIDPEKSPKFPKNRENTSNLLKNPEKIPNFPSNSETITIQHTEKPLTPSAPKENSSKKNLIPSQFPKKAELSTENLLNFTETNIKLPESHQKTSEKNFEPIPIPSQSLSLHHPNKKTPSKIITSPQIQDPKNLITPFVPEEAIKPIIADDFSIETPISSDSLFTPLEKTRITKVKAEFIPEEFKSDERKSDSSSIGFDAFQTSIINFTDSKSVDMTNESISPLSVKSPKKIFSSIEKIEEIEENPEKSEKIKENPEKSEKNKENIEKSDKNVKNDEKFEEIKENVEKFKENSEENKEKREKSESKLEKIEKFQAVIKEPDLKKEKNKGIFSSKFLENSGDLSSDRTKKLFNSTKNLIKHSQHLQTKPDTFPSAKTKSQQPLISPQEKHEPHITTPESSSPNEFHSKESQKNIPKNLFPESLILNPKDPTNTEILEPFNKLPDPSKQENLSQSLTNSKNLQSNPEESLPCPTKLSESTSKELKSPQGQVYTSDLFKSFNPFADSSSSDINLSRSEESSPLISPKLSTFRSLLTEDWSIEISNLINSEISAFLRIVSFNDCEKEVDTSMEFIMEYLNTMANELKENEFEVLDAINTPVYHEPLARLFSFQDPKNPILMKFPTLELILPPDLCSELKVRFESIELPTRQIYLQMLFDCVNEALNYIRPFGVIGIPDPWSTHPRILFGEAELENVFNRIVSYMVKWATSKSGTYHTAESTGDEEHLLSIREEKMSSLLCIDIKDEDPNWTYYEEEETQAKILTGNSIFDYLIDEILTILK